MQSYILGNIKRIIFESDTGPYKVGIFKVKETNDEEYKEYVNKVIGFTGSFNEINFEVDYKFYGKMVNHPKYGIQFNVETYEITVPSDVDSLIIYLSSGLFKGIGVTLAKKIVDKYKTDTINIIKNDYEKLLLIKGMTDKKAKMLHDKIVENEIIQDLVIKLNTIGFNVKEALDLISFYGLSLMSIIEENIYKLNDIISFDKLDLIYLKDHDELSKIRIKALIEHVINLMCYESGDTLIEKEELFLRLKKYFKSTFTIDIFISHINELLDEKRLFELNNLVTLMNFYKTEKFIYTEINRINNLRNIIGEEKLNNFISIYEKENKITFNQEQIDAIKGSIINNFYIITGGPGTGKTTIIKAIVDYFLDVGKVKENDIALLAPTGRSAKRMSESVNLNASTIHKFLKWNKETSKFQIDEYNKTHEKIIIVDEASMIDIFLFSSLLKGIKLNAKLILIGDANQLPSIGPGDVLNDLLHLNNIKCKSLNVIYRVKKGSNISFLADDIKNKKLFDKIENYDDFKFIESNDDNISIYLKNICENFKKSKINIDNFQILVPMYKGQNGIDNLNIMLSDIFNPKEEKYQIGDKFYKEKDKVIQLVNDIDNNVFNGDIGYIKEIRKENNKTIITIDYMGNLVQYTNGEFDKFNLAYAISIHKSQGSEYDNVVIILARSFRRMFYNKLIYTAVTRAKSSLYIIGSLDSFNQSIKTLYADNRNTYLKHV